MYVGRYAKRSFNLYTTSTHYIFKFKIQHSNVQIIDVTDMLQLSTPDITSGSLKWEASRRVFRLESGRIKLVRGDSDAASSLFYILRNYGRSKTIVLN